MAETVARAFAALPPELLVLLVAAFPIVELRGAIPIALGLGLSPLEAFVLGIVGNLVPVPILLWVLGPVRNLLAARGPLKPLFDWLERRVIKRRAVVDRYGAPGLALFVGLPVPGTGAWSGALLAVVLGIPFRRAFPAMVAGVVMAAILISLLSTAGFVLLTR